MKKRARFCHFVSSRSYFQHDDENVKLFFSPSLGLEVTETAFFALLFGCPKFLERKQLQWFSILYAHHMLIAVAIV